MTATQLEKAIALGLGRAIVYLLDHDALPYREIILDSCLHNKAYDPQIEGSRAAYLKDLMRASGEEAFFEKSIVDSLTQEAEDWDLIQRFQLGSLLAQEGNQAARSAMKEAFQGKVTFESDIASLFIQLDGIAGLLFVAARRGELLQQDATQWEDDYLLAVAGEAYGDEAVETALKNAAEEGANVSAYLAAVADNRVLRAHAREHDPKRLTFDDIRSLIENNEAVSVLYGWAQTASNVDMILAAQYLIQEVDPVRLRHYLKLFRKRQFPLSPERLFELVTWPDGPIPRHTLSVLANLKDERIRALAFKLVETKSSLRDDAINLLVNNFQPGDSATVEAWCDAESDPEVINSFSRSLRNFFAEHPDDEREGRLLLKLYEKEPCAHCRCFIVERLLALDSLPDELRRECEYDVYPDTRALLRP